LRRLSASLEGARIAVDAGHGLGDPGVTGLGGTTEAAESLALASAVADELHARGATPFLLRSEADNPPIEERSRGANAAGAEVLVSIHLNSHDDPGAEGVSTYYYGQKDWFSQAGQRLAELIQHEITSRLGLKDGRTHPMSLPLLRETQMPAVQVEPCFITNPREAALLATAAFRAGFARAIADAIELFFGRRPA